MHPRSKTHTQAPHTLSSRAFVNGANVSCAHMSHVRVNALCAC